MILAIDPSINNLGYAVFEQWAFDKYADWILTDSGVIRSSKEDKKDDLASRIQLMLARLTKICTSSVDRVIVEEPDFVAVDIMELRKLWLMVGAIIWWAYSQGVPIELIPVRVWKGQLSKKITHDRMKLKYGIKFETYDHSDAVGLGDWWINDKKTN